MTVQAEKRVLPTHPDAVVADPDTSLAPALDRDIDAGGVRIQSVLRQFLHRRGRTLDRLAGRDLVRDGVRQDLDRATHTASTP